MKGFRLFSVVLPILLLAACAQKESSQASSTDSTSPHATISMRDGTTLTGAVTSSTPAEITLNTDGGGTRTILTKDVKSVEYGEAPVSNQNLVSPPANNPKDSARPIQEARNQPAADRAPAPAPAPQPQPRYHPDKSAIQTKTFEIPSGTEISVRNDEAIDSGKAVEGQTYAAEVVTDVRDENGAVVIPRGANAQLTIRSISNGGRIRGSSDLVLALSSISIAGQQYSVNTTDLRKEGKDGIGANKRTGEYVGGGAALGAIIGAIGGGGKGAAIGAASGAGAGAITQILTKGKSIKVPAETAMTFRLDTPVRVIERR
jgi:hypothetical protein